jgi:hypothetical protein
MKADAVRLAIIAVDKATDALRELERELVADYAARIARGKDWNTGGAGGVGGVGGGAPTPALHVEHVAIEGFPVRSIGLTKTLVLIAWCAFWVGLVAVVAYNARAWTL